MLFSYHYVCILLHKHGIFFNWISATEGYQRKKIVYFYSIYLRNFNMDEVALSSNLLALSADQSANTFGISNTRTAIKNYANIRAKVGINSV